MIEWIKRVERTAPAVWLQALAVTNHGQTFGGLLSSQSSTDMDSLDTIGMVLSHSRPKDCLNLCLVCTTWLQSMIHARIRFDTEDIKYICIVVRRCQHANHTMKGLYDSYKLTTFLKRMVLSNGKIGFKEYPLEYKVHLIRE